MSSSALSSFDGQSQKPQTAFFQGAREHEQELEEINEVSQVWEGARDDGFGHNILFYRS